jgi:hypothetical protein
MLRKRRADAVTEVHDVPVRRGVAAGLGLPKAQIEQLALKL